MRQTIKSLTPNKTRSQVQTALVSGFFWSDNKPIEFEKKTIKNGIPFIERHKGIILMPIHFPIDKIKKKLIKDSINKISKAKIGEILIVPPKITQILISSTPNGESYSRKEFNKNIQSQKSDLFPRYTMMEDSK